MKNAVEGCEHLSSEIVLSQSAEAEEEEGAKWDEEAAWDLWEAGKGPNHMSMMVPEERETEAKPHKSARALSNVLNCPICTYGPYVPCCV